MSPLNKSKGNMYGWCTHTWNPIKGKCPHECIYCYMKGKPVGELRLDEKEFKVNLGSGKTIFVGSGTDMWFSDGRISPVTWKFKVLKYCKQYPENIYLFQTKNPGNYFSFLKDMPPQTILATTMETDRFMDDISKAPPPMERYNCFIQLPRWRKAMVSIEPIMDFDLELFAHLLRDMRPDFVSIGADSKGHKLPEPSPEKIRELIVELEKFTEVKIKSNLNRLLSRKEKRR